MKIIKRVIQNILNKNGYYKTNVPEGGRLTEADVIELYKMYGENKVFRTHLRDLCDSDKDLYYIATNDRERDMIRGATQRTKYFLSLINKANDTTRSNKTEGKDRKDEGVTGRY